MDERRFRRLKNEERQGELQLAGLARRPRAGDRGLSARLLLRPSWERNLPTKKPAPPPIPVPVLPSTWHFEFTGYVWGSSLSGYAGVGPFPALPFYANFAKVIEHFDGALMGAATVSNGTFIVGVDFNWSRLTGAETFQDSDAPASTACRAL